MEGYKMYQAKILTQQGMSSTAIAEALQVTRKTVYNYLCDRVFGNKKHRGRPSGNSKLALYHAHINECLEQDFTLNAEVLFDDLRKKGYQGRISILRDYLLSRRTEMTNYAVLRFETMPGQQAQVDWADAGWCGEGKGRRKRYAFVMKLGFSRRSYVEFTESMEQSVLFACMEHAFDYFGGVTREILFDNMKTAFLFDSTNQCWMAHPKMLEFAHYYGFVPKRCRVRRPKTKGKVEREIRYLRYSFFPRIPTMPLVDTQRLNEQVLQWLARVDDKILREFGQSRKERFVEDERQLQSLPTLHFDYRQKEPLLVRRDGIVIWKTNLYSVPASFRGKKLEGRIDTFNNTLSIYHGNELVRQHPLELPGAHQTHMHCEDKRELLKLWEQGRDQEVRRMETLRKKQTAQRKNVVTDPKIYDHYFGQDVLEAVL